jgi:hypothetical protein
MKKYINRLKESTEKIPFEIYGNGNLTKFLEFFIKKYNKLYKTNYSINKIKIDFKEKELKSHIFQIFVRKVEKIFYVTIQDVETYNYLYKGNLFIEMDYSGNKMFSNVIWDAIEQNPKGNKTQVSFIFE